MHVNNSFRTVIGLVVKQKKPPKTQSRILMNAQIYSRYELAVYMLIICKLFNGLCLLIVLERPISNTNKLAFKISKYLIKMYHDAKRFQNSLLFFKTPW